MLSQSPCCGCRRLLLRGEIGFRNCERLTKRAALLKTLLQSSVQDPTRRRRSAVNRKNIERHGGFQSAARIGVIAKIFPKSYTKGSWGADQSYFVGLDGPLLAPKC